MRNPILMQVPSIASAGITRAFSGSRAQALPALSHHQLYKRTLPPAASKSGCRRVQPHCPYTPRTHREHLLKTGLSPTCAPRAGGPGVLPQPPPTSPPAFCRSRAGRGAYQGCPKDFPLPSPDTNAPLPCGAPLHSHRRRASFTF